MGWPELANMGECRKGEIFRKTINGKDYYGIVCHSLEKGWGTPEEQTQIIEECFDKIPVEGKKIASIAIGNGLIGIMSGADYEAITLGMSKSDKDIVLYGKIPEKVLEVQEESKISIDNIEIPEYIKRISEIKKDELTERGFYEKVLEQIAVSEDVTLETAKLLKQTLLQIGCKKYKEWEAEKIAKGEKVESFTIGDGIEKGDIGVAVSMVSQFLSDYESAEYGQAKMLDGGEEYGWLQTWLRNSRAIEEDRNINDEEKKKQNIEAEKAAAIKVFVNPKFGSDIDAAIKTLEEYRNAGKSVVIDFNGSKLYSCDFSIDSVYKDVLGMEKDEFDKFVEKADKEREERRARKEAEVEAKIPGWIEKGKDITYPERLEEWERCVKARASDLYNGIDLENAIEIMEKLESGAAIEEAEKIFEDANHSGFSAGMVRSIVFTFSRRGPEFYEKTNFGELSEENKKAVEDKKLENARLDKENDKKEKKSIDEMTKNLKIEDLEGLTEEEILELDKKLTETLEDVTRKLEEEEKRGKLVKDILNKSKLIEQTNQKIEQLKQSRNEKNTSNKIEEII